MILVVDDNPLQALTRKAILSTAGLEAETAHTAEAAFEAIERDSAHAINLVVTDHVMPGRSGSHFVRLVWQRRQGLPILILTGLAEAEEDYAGLDVTFRLKPIPPSELIDLAKRLSTPSA